MPLARLFAGLRGGGRAHDPTRPWAGPADATPIHTMLDHRGVPWRSTRGELAERFGDTGGRIEIVTPRPFLPDLVAPLATPTGADLPIDLPAEVFEGRIRRGGTPTEALRATAAEVSLYLGRVRMQGKGPDAACLWRFGHASLELRAAPEGCRVRICLGPPQTVDADDLSK